MNDVSDATKMATVIRRELVRRGDDPNARIVIVQYTDEPNVAVWSSYRRRGIEPFSPFVNALQKLCKPDPYKTNGRVLYSPGLDPSNDMCAGMVDFLFYRPEISSIAENEVNNHFERESDVSGDWASKFDLTEANVRSRDRAIRRIESSPLDILIPPVVNLANDRYIHRIYMMLAFALIRSRLAPHLNEEGPEFSDKNPGHNIGAVLVSRDGKVLSWGRNSNRESNSRTCHAEVNAVQAYYYRMRRAIPEGARFYTTLKPCKMCAGMIHSCAEDPNSIQAYYAQDDPKQRYTVLDRRPRRVFYFDATDVEPLRSFSSHLYQESKEHEKTIPSQIQKRARDAKRQYRERFKITSFLRLKMYSIFRSVSISLYRKFDKYSQFKSNDDVERVLKHIEPLLGYLGFHQLPKIVSTERERIPEIEDSDVFKIPKIE